MRLVVQRIVLALISLYQDYIRTVLPSSCRFSPSCSEYSKQAIAKYGFVRGLYRSIIRLSHCHPFSQKAGDDPLV